ncbi:MAG: RNA methyltransferase [Acinetobacter sp.]|nr:RNA methyltransferase [Acinetobacter sp.]
MLKQIKIVMVNTTLPANIGSALRAMKTMGISQLVLVAPKHFPHPDIQALAAGADDLIPQIQCVATLEQALADSQVVFATSARQRHIAWPLISARQASEQAVKHLQRQENVAIVFGREDRGLTNEELALANYHLTIPVNPEYGVLNVAQAIQIVCYELYQTVNAAPAPTQADYWDEPLVYHDDMQKFYPHLEQMLQDIEFLDPENPRLLPLRLRRLFGRIQLDRMEYHLLRGIFSRVQALSRGQWQKSQTSSTGENDV